MPCVTCKYCNKGEIQKDLSRTLVCTRYPPQQFLMPDGHGNLGIMVSQPQVKKDFDCGEYAVSIKDTN